MRSRSGFLVKLSKIWMLHAGRRIHGLARYERDYSRPAPLWGFACERRTTSGMTKLGRLRARAASFSLLEFGCFTVHRAVTGEAEGAPHLVENRAGVSVPNTLATNATSHAQTNDLPR